MKSNSMVTEAAAGCENLRFTKMARVATPGIIDAETTHLQPLTVADKIHHMLCWILALTVMISEVPQALQGHSRDWIASEWKFSLTSIFKNASTSAMTLFDNA